MACSQTRMLHVTFKKQETEPQKKKKKTAPWPSISHLPREQDLKSIAGEVKMNLSVTFCCGHKNMKTVALVTH